MVELEVLKCPRCGADVQLVPGRDLASCDYCGAKLSVEKLRPGGLGTDVDKKRYALELQRQELAEHEAELAKVNAEIAALEAGPDKLKADNLMIATILLFMVIFFDLFLFPLFYFLDISSSFGVSRGLCLTLGLSVLIVSLALIVASRVAHRKAVARRREETLRSSEYQRKVQRRKELEDEIRGQQAELDRAERELRALLKVVGPSV